jgi:hypothetical protein
VTRAADWPYSSIHPYIEAGMMDHDRAVESAATIKAAMARENDVVGVRSSPQPTVLIGENGLLKQLTLEIAISYI